MGKIDDLKREKLWNDYQDAKSFIMLLSGIIQNNHDISKEQLDSHLEATDIVCKKLKNLHNELRNSVK